VDITYRQLQQQDATRLIQLRLAVLSANPYSFSITEDEERQASKGVIERVIDNHAKSEERQILGAWGDGDLLGVVGMERYPGKVEKHKAHLWGPYVHTNSRHQGIGCTLVRKAVDFSFSITGVELILIEVSKASRSALSIFKNIGFVETGVQKRALCFNGKYVDLLYMQMSKPA
jgi:ribosomal protein S18 acetylase RimI-like enzyme